MLLDDELAAQRDHEQYAQPSANQREEKNSPYSCVQRKAKENQRGSVKMTPAATDSPAEPVVCTMFVFKNCGPANARKIEIESTEMGNRCGNREASAEPDVHRHRAEQDRQKSRLE